MKDWMALVVLFMIPLIILAAGLIEKKFRSLEKQLAYIERTINTMTQESYSMEDDTITRKIVNLETQENE